MELEAELRKPSPLSPKKAKKSEEVVGEEDG
jgi:hypothetical protein